MTERIRALLDEAIADVGPRNPDPLPDVLRRAGARRRHLVVAGAAAAVAVAVLAAGGIVTANRGMPGKAPASQPSATPARPARVDATVAGGFVRTGGLAVPIPQGWQVVRDKEASNCDIPAKSVLINVVQVLGTCTRLTKIAVEPWEPVAADGTVPELSLISEVILPGGQPVWMDAMQLRHWRATRKETGNSFSAAQPWMPWAGVEVGVYGPQSQIDATLRGISADPVTPARLTLPKPSAAIQLNLRKGQLVSTDEAVIGQVLGLLAELDQPVQPDELPCTGAEQLTDTWRLAGTEMAGLTFTDARGRTASATVAISTGDTCAFATSSLGGRVHLPAGFLARVEHLLGGR